MKIICPKCNHGWNTDSELVKVTCPSCNIKIPNPNHKIIQNEGDNKEDDA